MAAIELRAQLQAEFDEREEEHVDMFADIKFCSTTRSVDAGVVVVYSGQLHIEFKSQLDAYCFLQHSSKLFGAFAFRAGDKPHHVHVALLSPGVLLLDYALYALSEFIDLGNLPDIPVLLSKILAAQALNGARPGLLFTFVPGASSREWMPTFLDELRAAGFVCTWLDPDAHVLEIALP